MIELGILALIKIFDNVIMSWKSLCTYREQKVLSSILTIISQLMFYFIIKKVVDDNTVLLIVIISISSGIGNYIGFIVNDKFKKSTKYMNIITSSNIEGMFDLSDYLVRKKIKCVLNKSLDRKKEDSYTLTVFANTKEQSKIIDRYLEDIERKNQMKYMREVLN